MDIESAADVLGTQSESLNISITGLNRTRKLKKKNSHGKTTFSGFERKGKEKEQWQN